MNPSNIPALLRNRSRSPSPSRRLSRQPQGDVEVLPDVADSSGMPLFTETQSGRHNQLQVPGGHAPDGHNRLRSFSDYDQRRKRARQRELDDMANVEVMANVHHSINTADHDHDHIDGVQHHHRRHNPHSSSDSDLGHRPNGDLSHRVDGEPGNRADGDGIFTTQPVIPDQPLRCPSRNSITGRIRDRARSRAATEPRLADGDFGGNCTEEARTRYGSTDDSKEGARNGDSGHGEMTPDQVDQLRRRVKFFFMDPFSKFKARKHLPWKMFLQLLKIVLITVQVIQFGAQRTEVVTFFERNHRAMQHLMLSEWDPGYETMPYPPATGQYALYSKDDLFKYINFAWEEYYKLSSSSLSSVTLLKKDGNKTEDMNMCVRFSDYKTFPNGTYVVDSGEITYCYGLVPFEGEKKPYDIVRFLDGKNISSSSFSKLMKLDLSFRYNTFHLNLMETHYGPTCYTVNATITYQNDGTGQALITLDSDEVQRECAGKIMSSAAKAEENTMREKNAIFDSVVIAVCAVSTLLCIRSLYRGWQLKKKVEQLFLRRYGKKMIFSDRLEFVNFWYFLIIINDVFTIIGAAIKIQLEFRVVSITSLNYDACSLMLGFGCLLAWVGCLRYLGFFKKYNILILTLKLAAPNILRFMVCALSIYGGFMFSGWLILSPYHVKFRHISTASECLYSLINGDDMFVSFSATVTENSVIWYFSRVYLYTFISLFIYCVLSLFIAVIMDVYETLKDCYEHGFPKTDLQTFIEQCNDPLHSGLYRRQHTESMAQGDWSLIECLGKCCCRRRDPIQEMNERSRLVSQSI